MSDSISLEIQFFLVSILSGAILLIVYDMIRIFRRIIKHTKILVGIQDIFFWIVSSIFIFIMMYKQNNGAIRGFSIMGMGIGMLVYNQFLSNVVVHVSTTFIHKMMHLIKKVIMMILFPFQKVFGFIFKYLRRFFRFIKRKTKKIKNHFLNALKKFLKKVKISIRKD